MAVSANKYHQVSEPLMATDDSQPATTGQRFKVGMRPMALIVGSGLMFLLIRGASTPNFSFDGASDAASMNLVGLPSVSRVPSGVAMKPGIMHSMKSLRGSSPFQNAMLANNLQSIRQDIKVRHGDDGWDAMPADLKAKEAAKYVSADTMNGLEARIKAKTPEEWNEIGKELAPKSAFGTEGGTQLAQDDVFKIMGGLAVLTPAIIMVVNQIGSSS